MLNNTSFLFSGQPIHNATVRYFEGCGDPFLKVGQILLRHQSLESVKKNPPHCPDISKFLDEVEAMEGLTGILEKVFTGDL